MPAFLVWEMASHADKYFTLKIGIKNYMEKT